MVYYKGNANTKGNSMGECRWNQVENADDADKESS